MSKNLNLKVDEQMFFEFHRLKSLLRAGTNQTALSKMLYIVSKRMEEFENQEDREKFVDQINKDINVST